MLAFFSSAAETRVYFSYIAEKIRFKKLKFEALMCLHDPLFKYQEVDTTFSCHKVTLRVTKHIKCKSNWQI